MSLDHVSMSLAINWNYNELFYVIFFMAILVLDYLWYICLIRERICYICSKPNVKSEMHIVCKHVWIVSEFMYCLCINIEQGIASSRLTLVYLKSPYHNQSYHVLYCWNYWGPNPLSLQMTNPEIISRFVTVMLTIYRTSINV